VAELSTSLLSFVARVRCRRKDSARSLSHLQMSFLLTSTHCSYVATVLSECIWFTSWHLCRGSKVPLVIGHCTSQMTHHSDVVSQLYLWFLYRHSAIYTSRASLKHTIQGETITIHCPTVQCNGVSVLVKSAPLIAQPEFWAICQAAMVWRLVSHTVKAHKKTTK